MKNMARAMHARIVKFLRGATNIVMRSYGRYLKSDLMNEEGEIKEPAAFKAFHEAGKSAAGHLEVLLKLTKNAEGESGEDEAQKDDDMRRRVIEANVEINEYDE